MKYLITLLIAVLSLNAFSQGIPQLPYNPDENGDGLIGVPDLQALLAQYGLEFNSAVLSEDAQSAIVYMGEMAHPVCSQACDNLPGFWHMSTMADLGLVWGDLVGDLNSGTWIKTPEFYTTFDLIPGNTNMPGGIYLTHLHYVSVDNIGDITLRPSLFLDDKKCYCAAHELPKVEYSFCSWHTNTANDTNFQDCCSSKVQDGWYPLNSNPSYSQAHSFVKSQAFWRWAVE